MNLEAIPWTTAAVRVALEANGGDESAAALSVWRAMKVTPVLCETIFDELSTGGVVFGPTVTELQEEQRRREGAVDYAALSELLDLRENPTLAERITSEATERLADAFRRAVAVVAADWRATQR
jgi:hypothetical protein